MADIDDGGSSPGEPQRPEDDGPETMAALAEHLRAAELEDFADRLRRLYFPGCRLSATLDAGLVHDFLVSFEKRGDGVAALGFHPQFASGDGRAERVMTLCWIMPLLAKFTSSPQGIAGSVVLNHWDAAFEPGLAYCGAGAGFFLIPDNVFVANRGYRGFLDKVKDGGAPWKARRPVAFWRGSTTGQAPEWRQLPRVRLCELSRAHPDLCDAGITAVVQWPPDAAEGIAAAGLMRPYIPASELNGYKYLIDIDGNGNAWTGLFERLASGGAVLKVESPLGLRQWYYDRMRPWTHYVPVRSDMSDLVAKIRWLIANDAQAERIGRNGRELALSLDYERETADAVETINAAFRAASARRSELG